MSVVHIQKKVDGLSAKRWFKFFATVLFYIIFSIVGSVFIYIFMSTRLGRPATLIELTLVIKLVSLFALIVIGGAEITESSAIPAYIRKLNFIVIALTTAVFSSIVLRLVFAIGGAPTGLFHSWYEFIELHGDVIAISPLAMYATLNAVVSIVEYFRRKGNIEVARQASHYFILCDLPCVTPIIMMIFSVKMIDGWDSVVTKDVELFLSGAMALFIFTSNFLSISVKHVTADHKNGTALSQI